MKYAIEEICERAGISAAQLAQRIDVTLPTINKWVNGKTTPKSGTQDALYEMCKTLGVTADDLVVRKISAEQQNVSFDEKRTILYHGSKSGIRGEIRPCSREMCDFGQGFYMGTIPEQPSTLVCGFPDSVLYVVSIDTSNLKVLNVPVGMDWAMLVAFHRGKMDGVRGSSLYAKCAHMLDGYDVITGCIANDKMFYVLDSFFEGSITDRALINSLSALKLGEQFVCKTQAACDSVCIECQVPISPIDRRMLSDKYQEMRIRGRQMADEICKQYRREGRYFDEILNEAARE